VTFFSLEDTCASDVVILAVPIHAFEEHLVRILPLLSPRSILVDVSTVKLHTTQILKRLAGTRPYIATHPMFGPESYTKTDGDVTGFRVVIAEHTLPTDAYTQVTEFLTSSGFTVIEMSADTHDRHLAETLFLTHFVGQVVSTASFVRTEIDTVSFGFLMNAVESVKNDTNLFKDVYQFNPYCEETITRIEKAEKEVHALLES
jgi:prephenate dehydrogenase